MTASETRSFIGDTIDITYFNGSSYVDSVASYDTTVSFTTEYSTNPVDYVVSSGNLWLRYSFTHSDINSNVNYITFSARPRYSIYDTEYLYTAFACRANSSISIAAYQAPQSNWYIGGSGLHFENQNAFSSSSSGIYASIGYTGLTGFAPYVPIMHSQSSTFSAYSIDATFYGPISGSVGYFFVMCPYVSSGTSGASGTFSSASSGSSTTIAGSGTDLTETNGLIGRVITAIGSAVSSVIDGIAGLFVPDDEFLEDWVDGMKTLLSDHLGGLYQAIDLLTDFYDVYQGVTVKQSIHVDTVSIPLAGTSFTLGGWDMPLKVTGLPAVLYDGIAYIVDFLAVMMFLKMCRNKLEIILNPDSEVVQNDN